MGERESVLSEAQKCSGKSRDVQHVRHLTAPQHKVKSPVICRRTYCTRRLREKWKEDRSGGHKGAPDTRTMTGRESKGVCACAPVVWSCECARVRMLPCVHD